MAVGGVGPGADAWPGHGQGFQGSTWLSAPELARLRSGAWFGQLAPERAQALLAVGRLKRLAAGETLFLRGDAADGLFAVLDGHLRISGMTADGKEAILSIIDAPQWFGEIAAFDGLPRTHDVVAEGATRLLHVPARALEGLLQVDPLWWRELGQLMALRTRLVLIGMEDLALHPAEVRLARRLLMLVQAGPQAQAGQLLHLGQPVVLPISQQQLGMMLSLSRQTVNQLLHGLQAQGIVHLAYGRIELRDMAALAGVAELARHELQMLEQVLPGRGMAPQA
jgi:CRP/FNR family cyclic AMP-dependent transcriptional regulator